MNKAELLESLKLEARRFRVSKLIRRKY